MHPFTHTSNSTRVIFGFGTVSVVAEEVATLGGRRALVLATPQQEHAARALAAQMGTLDASVFAGAMMHTPVAVTEAALTAARQADADCIVALGGGSTIGLGKAIALRTELPIVAVPTTYAGSEATPIIGETRDGTKSVHRSAKALPATIVYDVELTLVLPVAPSVASGINAIAHAAEALYARECGPVVAMMAEAGLAALARALPAIVVDPADREARSDALFGAWLCGTCLGSVSMALHHKLCHVLGGRFNLPHAETHAVILPHALAYNTDASPDAMSRIARALGVNEAAAGLHALATSLGAPRSLADLGMPVDGIAETAAVAARDPYWNPAPIEEAAIRALLERAHAGLLPVARTQVTNDA
jgi:alcohol dehydrogenase class IV